MGGRGGLRLLGFALLLLSADLPAMAQETTSVVMLSDLHFDPLRDSGKAARLADAPIADWSSILRGPDTAKGVEAFAAIQQGCGARGLDSDAGLLAGSLHEAADHGRGASYVVVSGDLLVHAFRCRYKMAFKDEVGFATFAEKTANYVMGEVERAFAGVPVYFALGNNDSACGDYRLDVHDRFLKATSAAVLRGMVGAGAEELAQARKNYETEGNYGTALPGIHNGRLLVVNDTFLSRSYKSCEGERAIEGPASTAAWFAHQLEAARAKGEHVWVVGHIPPGVNVYSTMLRMRDVCAGEDPELFLSDERLSDLLGKYADVVKLAIFGHTHMDEIRVIHSTTEKGRGLPVKLVASVSPVDGNTPSFTVGKVNRATGGLRDYTVYVANDKTGAGAWKRDYSFGSTYGQNEFSFAVVAGLVDGFGKDRAGGEPLSREYIKEFFKGGTSPLSLVWPQAVCGMKETTAAGYRTCSCEANAK